MACGSGEVDQMKGLGAGGGGAEEDSPGGDAILCERPRGAGNDRKPG